MSALACISCRITHGSIRGGASHRRHCRPTSGPITQCRGEVDEKLRASSVRLASHRRHLRPISGPITQCHCSIRLASHRRHLRPISGPRTHCHCSIRLASHRRHCLRRNLRVNVAPSLRMKSANQPTLGNQLATCGRFMPEQVTAEQHPRSPRSVQTDNWQRTIRVSASSMRLLLSGGRKKMG